MQRMISTHIEASKIGRQIAEQVLDYQRRAGDTSPSSESSPDPEVHESIISPPIVIPQDIRVEIANDVHVPTTPPQRQNGTLPGYNHVRNNNSIVSPDQSIFIITKYFHTQANT